MAVATSQAHDLAQPFFAALQPYQGTMTWTGFCTLGAADLALGRLAAMLGNDEEAGRLLENARAIGARNQWPAVELRALLGQVELDPLAPGNQELARSVYARALQHGLDGVAGSARRFFGG